MCFLSFSFWIESPMKGGTYSLIFGVAFHFSITLNVQFKVVIILFFSSWCLSVFVVLSSVNAGSEFVYQLSFDSFLHCVTFLLQQLSVRDQVSWCLFFPHRKNVAVCFVWTLSFAQHLGKFLQLFCNHFANCTHPPFPLCATESSFCMHLSTHKLISIVCVHKPQLLKRKVSQSGAVMTPSAYQHNVLPLGHVTSWLCISPCHVSDLMETLHKF